MKFRTLAYLVTTASLFGPTLRAADSVAAVSNISAVTVYQDRAVIIRSAAVSLNSGLQNVLFSGLPDSIDPNLLQVSGSGSAEATILEVKASRQQLADYANERLTDLENQARDLRDAINMLDQKRSILKERTHYLDQIRQATVTPPTADGATLPNVAEWQELLEFYAQGKSAVIADGLKLDREADATREQLDAVQREINQLRASGHRALQDVVVRLDVASAGTMDLELSYTVHGASWSPTYDVRVASEDESIEVGYSAMVRQSTGEDWDDVKLTLSTARPALGGTPPELYPWFLDELRAVPLAAPAPHVSKEEAATLSPFNIEAETAAGYAAGDAMAGTRVRSELKQVAAAVSVGLTSATFEIPRAVDIPADNDAHKIPVTKHLLEGNLSLFTIPKLAELAYLQAEVTNTSEFPLIAGPVNLFLDGTYVARSHLETVMPQEEFDLDLGVDDGISVKRKLVNRLREDTGIVSRKKRVTYELLITVQNNHQSTRSVVVEDQLPIARHEDITVELLAPPTREIEQDEEGRITWRLDLEPAEKRELALKISVEYPADFNIGGLE